MLINNSPPFFTIIYATYRPGGIDLLAQSLAQQPAIYELVVVDRFPGRVEKGIAAKYLSSCGIPLRYYGPPEIPGVEFKTGQARAWNVGATLASTEHLIFVQDFVWFPPGLITAWLHRILSGVGNTSICGSANVHRATPPQRESDISIWNNCCWFNIHEEVSQWVPTHHELFNTYFPVYLFEEINGLDERGKQSDVGMALLAQMAWLGMWPEICQKLRIGMIDHRVWGGQMWSTCEDIKHQPQARNELVPKSPNPYCFKDVRADWLKKPGFINFAN